MFRFSVVAFLMAVLCSPAVQSSSVEPVEEIAGGYIDAWKTFYPSLAYSQGFLSSSTGVEDFSTEAIQRWVAFNHEALNALESSSVELSHDSHIDARLLARRIRSELEKWEQDRPHENDLGLYAAPIAECSRRVLDSDLLSPNEKTAALLRQFVQIEALCAAAPSTLTNGRPGATGRAMAELEKAALFYENELPEAARRWIDGNELQSFIQRSRQASSAVQGLVDYLRENLLPHLTLLDEPILGYEDYARKLMIYTDGDLTPEQLEAMALEEIRQAKKRIREVASRYWDETYGDRDPPRSSLERFPISRTIALWASRSISKPSGSTRRELKTSSANMTSLRCLRRRPSASCWHPRVQAPWPVSDTSAYRRRSTPIRGRRGTSPPFPTLIPSRSARTSGGPLTIPSRSSSSSTSSFLAIIFS